MTAYTPSIPQATDNPSVSQDQILQNFQTLQTLYGTSGDHYPWTVTSAPFAGSHAIVETPAILNTNPIPGNVIPSPTSGTCIYFAQTRNSQTTPFITRDGLTPTAPLTNIWPLLPIKAYALINITSATAGTIVDSFNITSISVSTSTNQSITINITNAMRTTTYGVIANTSSIARNTGWSIVNNTQFIVNCPSGSFSPYTLTVIVLEP